MYTVRKTTAHDTGASLYSVYGVPFLSEGHPCPFSEKGFKRVYEREVIQSMWDASQAIKKTGEDYTGPLRINHPTEEEPDVYICGLWEMTDIAEKEGYGLTITGNFLFIDEYTYKDIRSGVMPFWSTETGEMEGAGELVAIALLRKAPPEFNYTPFRPDTMDTSEVSQAMEPEQIYQYNSKRLHTKTTETTLKTWRHNMAEEEKKDQKNQEEEPEKKKDEEKKDNKKNEGSEPDYLKEMKNMYDEMKNMYTEMKKNMKDGEEEEKKDNEKDEEDKKDNESECDDSKKNEKAIATTPAPNMCSKRLVGLVRKFNSASVETLEKLEAAGLEDAEIEEILTIKKNSKEGEQVKTPKAPTTKENSKDEEAPLTEDEKEAQAVLDKYNMKHSTDFHVRKQSKNFIAHIKDLDKRGF